MINVTTKNEIVKLREYQEPKVEDCIDVLLKHNICFLIAETRTGKTLMSLFVADRLGVEKVLFVSKKKALVSIEKDFKLSGFDFDLTMINYESLHKLKNIEYDLVICDECHTLGGYPKPAKRAKDLGMIVRETPLLLLSATPTPESYSTLFHQVWISSYSPWRQYKNFYAWSKDFVIYKTKQISGRTIADYSCAIEGKVMQDIEPLQVSLTQKDAGFEFVINEEVLSIKTPTFLEKCFYSIQTDGFIKINDKKLGQETLIVKADNVTKLKSKCHQIASGSVITQDKQYIVLSDYKAVAIRDDMKKRGITKAPIYYKYKSELEVIKKTFGDLVTQDQEVFQSEEICIFASQFISGREGVKLDTADVIYMFNIDFAFLSYEQTRNRIQDFTREEPPALIWVFSTTGLEEKIKQTVLKKRNYTARHFKRMFLS